MTTKIFGMPQAYFFLNYKKKVFKVFFVAKESLILSAFKQKILDEIEQSKGIKPKKINFFKIFL